MASTTTKRSTGARSKSTSKPKSTSNGASNRASTRRAKSSGSKAATAKNGRSSSAARSSNGSSNGNGVVHSVASKAKMPLLAGGAAAAGVVGGLVLASRGVVPRKRVLGVPVSGKSFDFKPVAKEVHKAGKQLGRFADEIAQAREQARKIGDALS